MSADERRSVIRLAEAAVIVGGGRNVLNPAIRAIARGRPIIPVPFVSDLRGNSGPLVVAEVCLPDARELSAGLALLVRENETLRR